MRKIIAVSGGVDSVVLLHKMIQQHPADALLVAHFDHGIREDSADDAEFVKSLAEKHGLGFEVAREELGRGASEELARDRRYAFLRRVAQKHGGTIFTAHHGDDVVETIAINQTRGTGWRGLAVLDSADIERPLLHMTKAEIIEYAKQHNLKWHEDSTNTDTKYLRNDIRQKLVSLEPETKELLRLYHKRQVSLRNMIDLEIDTYISDARYDRYLLTLIPYHVAREVLRAIIVKETGQGLTRPQLDRALIAVKTLHGGKVYEAGDGVILRFTSRDFVVANRAEVV